MIITSASTPVAASEVATALVNLGTLGLGKAALTRARDAEAQAIEQREPLQDMRLTGELRALIERKFAEIGGTVEDAPVRYRYGNLERHYTLARAGNAEVMLLQIERKLLDLEDGNALNGLDSLQYALRGKTVRIFQPGLVNVTANLYELQKQWSEEENIRVETVPSFHLQELERGTASLAVVLKLDLSAPGPAASAARVPSASAPAAARPIRVFVSYSHQDAEYVDEKKGKSLLAYLRGTLEDEGFSFWWDARLNAGDLWDDVIRKELEAADIALVLVSQYFLSSKYCKNVEAKTFVAQRKAAKMVVFPVIVASCEWDRHEWLKSTQFEPRESRTIETDYTERGPREELYLKILKQLRAIGEGIRKPQP